MTKILVLHEEVFSEAVITVRSIYEVDGGRYVTYIVAKARNGKAATGTIRPTSQDEMAMVCLARVEQMGSEAQ